MPEKTKARFKKRLALFTEDIFHPLLNNHALRGTFIGYRSISVTGDIRAIYKTINEHTVEFVLLGTHTELYGA